MTASHPPYPPQGYPGMTPVPRAPEGTTTGTVWIWLIVVLPLVQMLASIPLLVGIGEMYTKLFGTLDFSDSASSNEVMQGMLSSYIGLFGPVLWVTLLSYLLSGVGVLLGWLDWRELRGRGVPKPFHWAWGFFAFTGAGTLVYLIGRTVVARRRTGTGLAPLWAGIVVYIVLMVATFAWTIALVASALSAVKLH